MSDEKDGGDHDGSDPHRPERAVPPATDEIAEALAEGGVGLLHCLDCGRQLVAIQHGGSCLFCGSEAVIVEREE